ncbi:hypothetical protein ACHAQH_009939 [Verticillium albo-atrum]
MAPVHPQTQSPFFSLPGEIREKIQRLCVLPKDDLDLRNSITATHPEVLFRSSSRNTLPLPQVMSTCKKMHMEMSSFAFSELIIHETKGLSGNINLLCHGNLRWERLRCVTLIATNASIDFITPTWKPFLV